MNIKNKTIFITGGTGSLGTSLVNKLLKHNCTIVVYSRDEAKQALKFGHIENVKTVIGDIRDYDKINFTLKRYPIDYIIHAAALKRIDDMEFYPDECVKTNIIGSENVANAALNNSIKKCILISTDKACKPINVYGSSKFIAERIFTNFDFNFNQTIFSSVRYGNVIASRGSFLPIFRDKIINRETINITSSEMTRFLFTLNDATDVVLNALEASVGGEVFIPKLNSYTLINCIKALEQITGKTSISNISGLRPGEKLHEDMLAETELDFTYEVENTNLLQIRPQYTNKTYQNFKKYTGPQFNSKLWVNDNVNELINLIETGLEC